MSSENERWKAIPGFPGYEASSLGNIRMLDRQETIVDKRGWSYERFRKGRVLSKSENRAQVEPPSYHYVSIMNRPATVHKLVCLAFHGRRPKNKDCVNHKDGDKHNNRPDNLEWVTFSENEKHSYTILGKKPVPNMKSPHVRKKAVKTRAKNREARYEKIINSIKTDGLSKKEASKRWGLCLRQIQHIYQKWGNKYGK